MNVPRADNEDREPLSPPVEIEYIKLSLGNVKIGDFLILINNNDQDLVHCLNKILQCFEFHYVDIYSINSGERNGAKFMYATKHLSIDQINNHVDDVFARQFGDEEASKKEAKGDSKANASIQTSEERIYHLPRNAFRGISEATLIKINQYLMLPQSAIVFHDLGFINLKSSEPKYNESSGYIESRREGQEQKHFTRWYRAKAVDNLFTKLTSENNLLRVISCKYEDKVPNKWIEKANYLFLFKPNTSAQLDALLNLYHSYLTSVFHSFNVLEDFVIKLGKNQVLVILPWWKVFVASELPLLRTLSATFPVRTERVRWYQF